jgi:hypothetical protein
MQISVFGMKDQPFFYKTEQFSPAPVITEMSKELVDVLFPE